MTTTTTYTDQRGAVWTTVRLINGTVVYRSDLGEVWTPPYQSQPMGAQIERRNTITAALACEATEARAALSRTSRARIDWARALGTDINGALRRLRG